MNILDNQGISANRTSHLVGTISDNDGNVVAQYKLIELIQGVHSRSFGHATLVDAATKGQKFSFSSRSTNTAESIAAVLNDGTEISSALVCAVID